MSIPQFSAGASTGASGPALASEALVSDTPQTRRVLDIIAPALTDAGMRVTPVIDRAFPLEEAAAAVRYLEDGDPVGKVVITT